MPSPLLAGAVVLGWTASLGRCQEPTTEPTALTLPPTPTAPTLPPTPTVASTPTVPPTWTLPPTPTLPPPMLPPMPSIPSPPSLPSLAAPASAGSCPGAISILNVTNTTNVEIVLASETQAGKASAGVSIYGQKRGVTAQLGSRSYFADACTSGEYNNADYSAIKLNGKAMRLTVDLSKIGCGCNAAFFLTGMQQNTENPQCKDYYCDASPMCGVACNEIDIMEANNVAFQSSFHDSSDHSGKYAGYGGGGPDWNGPRDFTSERYGPDNECIDTNHPFQVMAAFPVNDLGELRGMDVTLSQSKGGNLEIKCTITYGIKSYSGNSSIPAMDGMKLLGGGLRRGMTPVVSYWSAKDMSWLDGKGRDGKGPCDLQQAAPPCPSTVDMWDFEVIEIPESEEHGRLIFMLLGGLCVVVVAVFGLYQFAKMNTYEDLEEDDSESG